MGMDMYLYELTSQEEEKVDNEEQSMISCKARKVCELKEVLYLSRGTASIFVNWLYKNHLEMLKFESVESNIYVKIDSDDILDFLDNITKILDAPDNKRDLYALFYAPPLYNVESYVSSVIMFTDDYYDRLVDLKFRLSNLVFGENDEFLYKVFFCNISC